ncbi:MAG: hypothetical protein H6732_16425 [Alphaproteobacteria bacterium]|nr:hypothetical protein [Alphaproteobacteria bacterium]
MRGLLLGLPLLGLAACSEALTEGQYPGGCDNGVDDDGDQLFDCGDPDCFGAPVCGDGGGDSGNDSKDSGGKDSGGGDTGVGDTSVSVGDGVYANLKSFSMVYEVDWDGDNLANTVCQTYYNVPSCACTAKYYGEGTLIESEGTRNTYEGTWELVWTDCWEVKSGLAFNDGAIWRPEVKPPVSYHTFRWASTLTKFTNWVAHAEEANSGVGPPTNGNTTFIEDQRFFVRAGAGQTIAFDAESFTGAFTEEEIKPVDLIFFKSVSRFKWAFSETSTPPDLRSTITIPTAP